MIKNPRYVHTNLIARNWRTLAAFYGTVFGCQPVPPERYFTGPELERGTGIPGSSIEGIHMRLPGSGAEGPTLEIFSYSETRQTDTPAANRPGFSHIAFSVDSVSDAREEVLAAGGKPVGDIVTLETSTGARVRWCYVTDPEGNIVELQTWDSLS